MVELTRHKRLFKFEGNLRTNLIKQNSTTCRQCGKSFEEHDYVVSNQGKPVKIYCKDCAIKLNLI